jgi:hypothetical protein
MQEAKSGRKIKLLNFNIRFVVADHHYMTRYGNIKAY